MLNRISNCLEPTHLGMTASGIMPTQSRHSRNEKEDLKTAIDALFEFKRKLDELHPSCIDIIENMLQRPRY